MKKIVLSIIALFTFQLEAQNEVDALRYGQQENLGTARYVAMGGAFAALGGDLSSIKENPAATAVYRTSEFGVSMAIQNTSKESKYFNNVEKENRANFNIPNFSIVRVDDDLDDPNWNRLNMSFGLTRLSGFSAQQTVAGQHNQISYINTLRNKSQGSSIDDLYYEDIKSYLAFNTIALDTTSAGSYISWIDGEGQKQRLIREERGGVTELNLSVGASYNDKVFFGASVNIPIVNYESESLFSEFGYEHAADLTLDGIDTRFNRFNLREEVKTTGSGINAKFGVIAKPVFWWRLGLAIHTPTYYTLDEEYAFHVSSNFNSFNPINGSFKGLYSYHLTTPGKIVLGTSFILKKQGILSIEYNHSDYGNLEYSSIDEFSSIEEEEAIDGQNSVISDTYTSAGTLKIGAEWRYENLSFRGGYNHVESPLKYSDALEKDVLSFGLGYRWEQYFFDMAMQLTSYKESRQMYLTNEDTDLNIDLDTKMSNYVFTFGYKF